MNCVRLLILTVLFAMLSACGSGGGSNFTSINAVVSMNANISASELTINYTPYTAEYQAIYAAGARGAQTAARWVDLNPTGTTYVDTMVSNPYFGLDALASTYGFTSILINIPIVAIDKRTMPADIATNLFNDQVVKDRYRALILHVVSYLNSSVKYISLGNEVDTYLSANPSEWSQYKELIEDARTYIHSLKPNIKVGVTTTFDGATSTQIANVASLNENMDVIILTYYPTGAGFVPRDPSTVSTDMASMIATAAGKPLVMQEWGYPSSSILSPLPLNSEQMQADFITNTFSSWSQYGSSRIPFISFFKYRDWDAAQCTALTGQSSGQSFFEFMCSLGLLKNDGIPKTAYSALTTGISNMGF
jgi:Glycosyl hydrolase family 53